MRRLFWGLVTNLVGTARGTAGAGPAVADTDAAGTITVDLQQGGLSPPFPFPEFDDERAVGQKSRRTQPGTEPPSIAVAIANAILLKKEWKSKLNNPTIREKWKSEILDQLLEQSSPRTLAKDRIRATRMVDVTFKALQDSVMNLDSLLRNSGEGAPQNKAPDFLEYMSDEAETLKDMQLQYPLALESSGVTDRELPLTTLGTG
jgi:hypothetical protein